MIGSRCLSSCSDNLGKKAERRRHRLFGRGRQEMGGGNARGREGATGVVHAMRGRESGPGQAASSRRSRRSGAAGTGSKFGGFSARDHDGALSALLLPRVRRDDDGPSAGPARPTPLFRLGDRAGSVSVRATSFLGRRDAAPGLRVECRTFDGRLVDAQEMGRRDLGRTALPSDPPLS